MDEFWNGDKRLFDVYQKAYYRKLYETAWANGAYTDVVVMNALGNIFAKKEAKPLEYPKEPRDPFSKPISKETIANDYANLQKRQNDFIRQLLNSEK